MCRRKIAGMRTPEGARPRTLRGRARRSGHDSPAPSRQRPTRSHVLVLAPLSLIFEVTRPILPPPQPEPNPCACWSSVADPADCTPRCSSSGATRRPSSPSPSATARRHLRLGRRPLRPDGRQPPRRRPRQRHAHRRGAAPLGRHRGPLRRRTIRSGGHGFSGIGRKRCSPSCRSAARSSAWTLRFEDEAPADLEALVAAGDCDLVIAADGINSRIRERYAATFRPDMDVRRCRYTWLGTPRASTPSRSRSSRDGARLVPGARVPVR
jgi:hypothetical protein